jgi:ParB family transcriptional regulator, chromosome partitioning protein
MTKRRPALGRGLGALIPAPPPPVAPGPAVAAPTAAPATSSAVPKRVPIESLQPNPDQPRRQFEEARLRELADSIKVQGIIQPIVVSPTGEPGKWWIVAGERRWRASGLAGLHDVPIVVRETNEAERLELALVENLQRADLNPIEEARAFAQLIDLQGYTQDALAERVGKDRSTVSNALRLLRLPDKVQQMVRDGRLSMGHARTLLGLTHEREMLELAAEVVRAGLSVRATERAVRKTTARPRPADEDAERRRIIVGELENRLRRRLGVRARLRTRAGKGGTLEIPYGTLDELDRLLRLILDDSAGEG